MFCSVAVLSLALGIGANTAIFSLMDVILLRMLPVERPAELEQISGYFSYPMFRELRQRNKVFSGILARQTAQVSIAASGRTERGVAELASGNYFELLGVQASLGRVFTAADDHVPMGHPVVVLSDHYWRQHLSAEPAVIGKTIHVNNYPFTVVGIATPAFFGVEVGSAPDLWAPLMMQPQIFNLGQYAFDNSGWGWLELMARRAPGVDYAKAQAGLNVTFQQIIQEGNQKLFRKSPRDSTLQLQPGGQGFSLLRTQFENPLYLLMGVVGLVLLIACANLANLLLARSAGRRKEFALRLALGAGRLRLVRQLLTESVVLGLLGGALGVLFSKWSIQLLLGYLPGGDRVPLDLEVHTDARVLGFAALISMTTGLLFGLAPAIRATRPDVSAALKDENPAWIVGPLRFDLRSALAASQMALSLLLLVGAGLFLRSLRNVVAVDAGLKTESVLLASVDPSLNGYTPQQVGNFYRELRSRVGALPGVQNVALVEIPLLSGAFSSVGMIVPGRPLAPPGPGRGILINTVGGDFFQVTGGAIIRGRDFGPQDTVAATKVAVINQTAARYFFGDEDPIGKKVRLAGADGVEIIGIARDSKYRSVREEAQRIAYESFEQQARPSGERTIYVRTAGDPLALAGALRREVRAMDASLPVYSVKTFAEQKSESLTRERLLAVLSGFFSALALLLAAIGLYGVTSYNVQRRTREIGIRLSLGARPAGVLRMILRDCLLVVAAGIALGLPLSLWLGRLAAGQLYGVKAGDPFVVTSAALLLATAAALAGYLPALRASRVDPTVSLRYE